MQQNLKDALKTNVYFFRGTFDDKTKEKFSYLKGGEVILIENIRFFKEETEDDYDFSKKLGELGNIYINVEIECVCVSFTFLFFCLLFLCGSIRNGTGAAWDPTAVFTRLGSNAFLV